MTLPQRAMSPSHAFDERVNIACEQACASMAPAWPLDRAIAVNPHWARIHRPVRQVAARMAVLAGIQVLPSREVLQQAWDEGRLTQEDLRAALDALPAARRQGLTVDACLMAMRDRPPLPRLPLLIDVLDDDPRRHTRLSWRQAITHQVSQTCAAYFDDCQADWQPTREAGLYAFWRDTLLHDHGIGMLMGLPDLGERLHAVPTTREEAERWVLARLGLPESVWADYLEAVLLTIPGWASWCAYLGWQARLQGQSDPHLRDLLAIRLAWGVILLESRHDAVTHQAFSALQAQWAQAPACLRQTEDALCVDEVWQVALERGYQRRLAGQLSAAAGRPDAGAPRAVALQAAFCIDVRSEPLRRALEALDPAIQTIGCAGFFGLPIGYTPLATSACRPQLPGLLAPSLVVEDHIVPSGSQVRADDETWTRAGHRARQRRFAWSEPWHAASRWPAAAYAFVEAAGWSYAGKLAGWLRPSAKGRVRDDLDGLPARYRPLCRPVLSDLQIDAKVALAADVLRAMGLDRHLAPLVLLVGHGSQSANNAQAAALDCGACCGQTGEVNARVLAQMLNDPAVRQGLAARGIAIPADTVFIGALHNTTTDEIEGFDLDLLPITADAQWRRWQPVLDQAGDRVRRERAASLDLPPHAAPVALLQAMRRRANDGAQTRPEWGLAGNAAFLIAPRHRSRGLDLAGRVFLHDYDPQCDPEGSLLTQLMTAPMLVTHWINWQYHASTCDPVHLGSGNKLLHNVVGGHIGVFEGNGGDLRIGLSRQSLHDGQRWVHEPLRLTVVIDAPVVAIERVLTAHQTVRDLVEQGWLHLWRFEGQQLQARVDAGWQTVTL